MKDIFAFVAACVVLGSSAGVVFAFVTQAAAMFGLGVQATPLPATPPAIVATHEVTREVTRIVIITATPQPTRAAEGPGVMISLWESAP